MKKITVLMTLLLVATLAACGGITYPVEYDDGTVVTVEEINNSYIVSVEVNGFAAVPIEADLTITANGNVTAFVVTRHMETASWGKDVIEGDYITELLANQDSLNSVDAVSGSTATSDALKDAIRVAKAHIDAIR